jgi:DNA-binding transcriptional LysR family regulator
MVDEFQKKYEANLPITAELNSWELIARTVESHGGYALIPDLAVVTKKYPNLLPLSSVSVPYTICAIFPKGEELSYSAQTFLDLFREYMASFSDHKEKAASID